MGCLNLVGLTYTCGVNLYMRGAKNAKIHLCNANRNLTYKRSEAVFVNVYLNLLRVDFYYLKYTCTCTLTREWKHTHTDNIHIVPVPVSLPVNCFLLHFSFSIQAYVSIYELYAVCPHWPHNAQTELFHSVDMSSFKFEMLLTFIKSRLYPLKYLSKPIQKGKPVLRPAVIFFFKLRFFLVY